MCGADNNGMKSVFTLKTIQKRGLPNQYWNNVKVLLPFTLLRLCVRGVGKTIKGNQVKYKKKTLNNSLEDLLT